MAEGLFCVAPNEGLHKGGLADAGRTDDGDDGGRGLIIRSAVDEGDMEASLVALCGAAALSVSSATGLGGECLKDASGAARG